MDKNTEKPSRKSPKDWESDCLEMCPGVNLYTLPGVSIFIANKVIDFPAGQHSHNEYEFMMPLSANVIAQSDNESVLMEKQKLTALQKLLKHILICSFE